MRYILFCLLLLTLNFPTARAADLQEGDIFCTYPISGSYGCFPRYVFYGVLLLAAPCYRLDWFIGAAFSTAMLFSSVASVHLTAIAFTDKWGYWDPDSEPALNIVCYSLLAASILLIWSTSFRHAESATQVTVFVWIILLLCGLTSGVIYDDGGLNIVYDVEECGRQLPLRTGQRAVLGWYTFDYTLRPANAVPMMLRVLFPLQMSLAVACGITGRRPRSLFDSVFKWRLPWWLPCLRYRLYFMVSIYILQLAFITTVFLHVGIREYNMMDPDGWFQSEEFSAIGQWGPIVSAVFTFGAAAIVSWLKQKRKKETDEEIGILRAHHRAVHRIIS